MESKTESPEAIIASLRAELAEVRGRARRAAQRLIEEIGAPGPEGVDETAERAAQRLAALNAEVERLTKWCVAGGVCPKCGKRLARLIVGPTCVDCGWRPPPPTSPTAALAEMETSEPPCRTVSVALGFGATDGSTTVLGVYESDDDAAETVGRYHSSGTVWAGLKVHPAGAWTKAEGETTRE